MSIPFHFDYTVGGLTDVYAVFRKIGTSSIVRVSTGALVSDTTANRGIAAHAASDGTTTKRYVGSLHDSTPDGDYSGTVYRQAGGSPAAADDEVIGYTDTIAVRGGSGSSPGDIGDETVELEVALAQATAAVLAGTITITFRFRVAGTLTDVTSVELEDEGDEYGVKRDDTDAAVVASGTALDHPDTGIYSKSFTEPAVGLTYSAVVKYVYRGKTHYLPMSIVGSRVSGF